MSFSAPAVLETEDNVLRIRLSRMTERQLKQLCQGRIPRMWLLRKDEILSEMMNLFPLEELRDIASRVPPTSIVGRKHWAAEEVAEVDKRPAKRPMNIPDCYIHEDPDLREFMALPMDREYKLCIQGVRDRTSGAALRLAICMVCAREVFEQETDWIGVHEIPNANHLVPVNPNPHWELTGAFGLHRPAIKKASNGEWGALCQECRASLERDQLPWCALANNLWIGDVPFELAVLTWPEEILISLYFPTAFVYKLYPKSKRFDPESLQMGYRGNVSTYPLDTSEIASFIGARTLPHKLELLASTIAVTFVGPRNCPERSMRGLFRVRRHRVLAAILWLKEHNPLYSNIEIDFNVLESLPDGGIPSSIMMNFRFDPEGSRSDNDTGYVPNVGDDDDDQISSNVIPLQQMGVVDNDMTTIDSVTLLQSAIANLSEGEREEGIAVRRGSKFISEWPRRDPITNQLTAGSPDDPNHLLGAFPCLFPYAAGGFEVDRPHPVPYHRQGGWCLDYPDRRFRKNPAFIAQVFGVLHKRQVCSSASIQVRRPAYEQCEETISKLTVPEIQRIFSKGPSSESITPAMAMLKKQIYATSARVMGSNASRKSIRRRIYGLMAFLSPPTVWCTINLCDIDDPVAQVFVGDEDINMDAFNPQLGPDSKTRAHRIADDPYAAAKFFHYMVKVLLEELFGIRTTMQGLLRKKGVLGRINAYVGVVESQGRGTLHLHILFWLCGAPTGQKMKALLTSEEFRDLLKEFISKNIRAHMDGINETIYHTKTNLKSHVAWARPPDPFDEDACKRREFDVVSVSQKHDCGPGCAKIFKGRIICKRRAPFELSETDFVTEFGEWGPKRTFAWLNAWCPPLALCTGANNDMKLLLCGAAVIALAFYVTEYMTKKQVKSVNAGALISQRLAYHMQEEATTQDARERNRRLIYKCLNTLAREQELSGPELVSYIKGWGDRYYSHNFVAIIWSSMLYMLKREFPELRNSISRQQPTCSNDQDCVNDGDEHEADVRLQSFGDSRLGEKSQLQDYYLRSKSFAEWGLLFYLLQTREIKRLEKDDLDITSHGNRAERHFYQDRHPRSQTHVRVIRRQGHETIPEFIGPWFPRRADPSTKKLYCASMLLLFKPWTELRALKGESFEESFEEYVKECPQRELGIMDNIQWYYETADGVEEDRRKNEDSAIAAAFEDGVYDGTENEEEVEVSGAHPMSQVEGAMLEESPLVDRHGCSLAEWKNGEQAVVIGENCGILGNQKTWVSTPSPRFRVVTKEDTALWEEAVDRLTEMGLDLEVKNVEDIWDPRPVPPSVVVRGPAEALHGPMIDQLASDQRRAVEILDDHICDTLLGKNPPQLLMLVMGEGGTGKSKVIEAMTWVFEQRGLSHLLAKVGSTNVAANLIGGTTLHHLMVLPAGNPATQRAPSEPTKQKREAHLRSKRYLLGNEISMLTEEQIALSSDIMGTAHAGLEGSSGLLPFGGLLSVVFFGDYHQFPPVKHPSTALYRRNPPNTYAAIGRGIMEQFNAVVLLKEQKRVAAGSDWAKTLSRARYGACNKEDICKMKSLVLTGSSCNPLGFDKGTTVLVTPRNAVRIQWNQRAIRRWCMEKKKPLFIIHARDEIGKNRHPPSFAELRAITECREDQTGELSSTLELAEDMPVRVTFRHKKEKSLSKGASGVVKRIVISDRDAATDQTHGIVELQDLPKAIVLKLDHPPQGVIPGFQLGEVPILPYTHRFHIQPFKANKSSPVTVTRHQYGLVPAFAFTDYKAQGQTLNQVVVDIGQPARGHISQFNAYVAVSRGRGPESLRFLRDFDEGLFTSGVDEDLAAEDVRLEVLNHQTADLFTSVSGSMGSK
ncbi:hypothetical protein FRC01_005466 [Tulasnella sp. 417]|nr:hypothetical protein FRC01_005466 [Tulasnella sp. 417]